MSSSTRIIEIQPLDTGSIVCMSRTRHIVKQLIITGFGVLIPENYSQWSTGSISVENTAQYLRLISLDSRRGSLRSALTAQNILGEIFFLKRDSGLNAVQHHAYPISVRFSEYRNPEFSTERIHLISNYLSYLLIIFPKSSKNVGNDLVTQSVSSMTIGLSAPSSATLSAITIRWSWLEVYEPPCNILPVSCL